MARQTKYDYRELARNPKVFGFFIGWFGQRLFALVHMAQISPVGTESKKLWDLGRKEVCRLATMLRAWCDEHGTKVPQELVDSLVTLNRDFGPEGYRTSVQALREPPDLGDPRFRKAGDGCHALDQDYFPDILAEDHGMPDEFGELCSRLRDAVLGIGEATGLGQALGLGAGISGVAHALALQHVKGASHVWIQGLVDFGLLRRGTEIEKSVTPYTGMKLVRSLAQLQENFLGVRGEEWEQLRGELAAIPDLVCEKNGAGQPPSDSDITRMPKLAQVTAVERDEPAADFPPPLSEKATAVYKLLLELPEDEGLTGRQIVSRLREQGVFTDESTLTTHIIPKLKRVHGVVNRPNVGYCIPSDKRPSP